MYRKVERRGGASVETEQFSCAPFHHAGDGKKEREGEKERGPQLIFVKISAQKNFC